jgi:hypothetical protein
VKKEPLPEDEEDQDEDEGEEDQDEEDQDQDEEDQDEEDQGNECVVVKTMNDLPLVRAQRTLNIICALQQTVEGPDAFVLSLVKLDAIEAIVFGK